LQVGSPVRAAAADRAAPAPRERAVVGP
jgi:hypothetical protein